MFNKKINLTLSKKEFDQLKTINFFIDNKEKLKKEIIKGGYKYINFFIDKAIKKNGLIAWGMSNEISEKAIFYQFIKVICSDINNQEDLQAWMERVEEDYIPREVQFLYQKRF
jgi:hypothetical protein